MTRLLCIGDTHVGALNGYVDDPLQDFRAMFEQVVDIARDRQVDGVLIAGDVFDKPRPAPAELHVFRRFLLQLDRTRIPCVAVLGNAGHDQYAADQPTALELFDDGELIRVSRHPETLFFGGVMLCALPNAPVSRLVAQQGGRDDVNALAVELLLKTARELRESVSAPAVLLGHWAVSGASLPNGLPTSDLHEPVLPIGQLAEMFEAVVLGHIHRPQILSGTSVFYTGSPLCLNFGEASVDHGVWILHSDVNRAHSDDPWAAEFVPLDGRRFVTVHVDLAEELALDVMGGEGLDPTEFVIGELVLADLAGAVVRISYSCTEEQARRVDIQDLKRCCYEAGAHRVYQITPEIVRSTRPRLAGFDESLTPYEALAVWCSANARDADEQMAWTTGLGSLTKSYLEAE